MKLHNTYFVPLLDILIDFVENVTGYYAENIKEGWLQSPDYESGKMSIDRKSTRLNSSHSGESRMPSSA